MVISFFILKLCSLYLKLLSKPVPVFQRAPACEAPVTRARGGQVFVNITRVSWGSLARTAIRR